jgi:Uso1 / p115 like vesicle tethering protein, head region
VLSHIIAPPPPPLDIAPEDLELWEPPVPAGKVLLLHMAQAAASSDAAALTAACRVLDLLLLHGGGTTQEIALRVPLCLREGEQPLPLLQCVLLWVEEAVMAAQQQSSTAATSTSTTAEVLLQLLCRWLNGCSTAVSELLANPASLLIVDIAAQRSRGGNSPPPSAAGTLAAYSTASSMATVRGLACLLLGLILEYVSNDDSNTAATGAAATTAGTAQQWDRATVLSLIERRVGITQFTAAIDALRSTYAQRSRARRRKSAADSSSASVDSTDSAALDASFETLLRSAADTVRRRVVALYSGSDSSTAVQSSDTAAGAAASSADSADTATAATAAAAGDAQAVYRAHELISLQEAELQRLKQQLTETESRIPTDDGSASAAELALLARAEQAEAVAATATAAQARAQQLEGETRGLSLALTAQERLLSERDALVSSLQRQVAAAASGSASEREQELLLQLEELRTELASRGAQCDALQHDVAQATEAADTAEQYADECSARVTALQAQLAQATATASDLALLERRLADSTAWSTELESTLSARSTELDALRQRLAAAETHSSSSNGVAASSSELAAMQLRLGQAEAELATAAQEVAVLRGQRADRAALQQQLDSVSTHSRQLEQQVSSLQRELAVARAQQQQQQAAVVVPQQQQQQQQSQQQLAELQRQCQLRQQQLEAALQELGHSEELREHAATELAQLREALQHSESNAAAAVAAAQQAEARARALQDTAAAVTVANDSKPVVVAGLNEAALAAVVSEHNDLLVMLAQSQIEREQLIAALISTAGKGAVAHALQLTQRVAQARFGQYVDFHSALTDAHT